MNTGHVANIFSVKFLSSLNENLVVTGAADNKIRVHDITALETRHVFSCHSGRVKRLANTSSEPFLFWSASEDGTCRQFDLRDPDQTTANKPCNVLVNLRFQDNAFAEAKCIAINPLKSELVAIGGNEPFVRMFDRRKLTLSTFDSATTQERIQTASRTPLNIPSCSLPSFPYDAAKYFVPCHLPGKILTDGLDYRTFSVTSVSFSSNGEELLANIGRDNIYLFNLASQNEPFQCPSSFKSTRLLYNLSASQSGNRFRSFRIPTCFFPSSIKCYNSYSGFSYDYHCNSSVAPDYAAVLASRLIEAKAYAIAVHKYNQLIEQYSFCPQLYTGRATALIKRNWNGDIYNALLDCRNAMQLTTQCYNNSLSVQNGNNVNKHQVIRNSVYLTALLLSVRCLLLLDWLNAARIQLKQALDNFPNLFENTTHQKSLENSRTTSISITASSSSTFVNTPTTSTVNTNSSTNNCKSDNLVKVFEHLKSQLLAREKQLESKPNNLTRENEQFREQQTPVHDNDGINTTSENADNDIDEDDDAKDSAILKQETFSSSKSDNISEQMPSESWNYFNHDSRINSSLCACLNCSCDHMWIEEDEKERRKSAVDYSASYLGHCNSITDIKEANFFGSYGQYIVGGSDCGAFFIWDRNTTNIVRILKADSSTVNCVQPHPSICLLASSGIDSVIRLWSPNCEEDPDQSRVVRDQVGAAERNQQRSNADPLEIMLLNMGYNIPGLDLDFNRSRRSRLRDCIPEQYNEVENDSTNGDNNNNNNDSNNVNFERGLYSAPRHTGKETHTDISHPSTIVNNTLDNQSLPNSMNMINEDTEGVSLIDSQKRTVDDTVDFSCQLNYTQVPEQKRTKTGNISDEETCFQPSIVASVFSSDLNTSDDDSDYSSNNVQCKRNRLRRLNSSQGRHIRRIRTRRIPISATFPDAEIVTTPWLIDFFPIEVHTIDSQSTVNETGNEQEEQERRRNTSREDEEADDNNSLSEVSCT
ncbi:WD and tetratricopeptide repeats protein 1 [Schistosoma japonicum]|nr:WD and tetratricopeptide repeats protein 1 [Schistosoma japonicum]